MILLSNKQFYEIISRLDRIEKKSPSPMANSRPTQPYKCKKIHHPDYAIWEAILEVMGDKPMHKNKIRKAVSDLFHRNVPMGSVSPAITKLKKDKKVKFLDYNIYQKV